MHSSQALRYTGRELDRVSGWETDASIELSVIPPQTQTETARIYISSVRHSIQSVYWALLGKAALNSTKFEPSKHSLGHMLFILAIRKVNGINLQFQSLKCSYK